MIKLLINLFIFLSFLIYIINLLLYQKKILYILGVKFKLKYIQINTNCRVLFK